MFRKGFAKPTLTVTEKIVPWKVDFTDSAVHFKVLYVLACLREKKDRVFTYEV